MKVTAVWMGFRDLNIYLRMVRRPNMITVKALLTCYLAGAKNQSSYSKNQYKLGKFFKITLIIIILIVNYELIIFDIVTQIKI
jgi:hypothetical protein